MTTTQIALTIVAISLTSVALFGSYKYASAHSNSYGWKGGIMHKIHALSDDDWNNPQTIQQFQQVCVDRSVDRFDTFRDHVAAELDLQDDQSQAWNELLSIIQNEKTTVSFVCEKLLTRENTKNLPARLELLSTLVATGQETLQRLTPAISQFYAVLNDKQKEHVESLIAKHHQRHGMMHH